MQQQEKSIDRGDVEPFVLHIEVGKVREFYRALGMPIPDGIATASVPPTFLTTMRHWTTTRSEAWPRLGFAAARTLHASEEYEFTGTPPRVGQTLTGQSRIDEVYERTSSSGQHLRFGVMITEFTDESGALVARATLRGVERSGASS